MQHLHTKRLPVFYENSCCAYTVVAEDLRFVESLIFARTNTSCSDDNDDDNDEDDDDHDDEDKDDDDDNDDGGGGGSGDDDDEDVGIVSDRVDDGHPSAEACAF